MTDEIKYLYKGKLINEADALKCLLEKGSEIKYLQGTNDPQLDLQRKLEQKELEFQELSNFHGQFIQLKQLYLQK